RMRVQTPSAKDSNSSANDGAASGPKPQPTASASIHPGLHVCAAFGVSVDALEHRRLYVLTTDDLEHLFRREHTHEAEEPVVSGPIRDPELVLRRRVLDDDTFAGALIEPPYLLIVVRDEIRAHQHAHELRIRAEQGISDRRVREIGRKLPDLRVREP